MQTKFHKYGLYIRESGDIDRLDNVTELLRSIVAQETEFGEGIIEEVDERTKTYYICFINGTKPINFDYTGLSHIF